MRHFRTFPNIVKFSWLEGLKGSVLQNEEETSFEFVAFMWHQHGTSLMIFFPVALVFVRKEKKQNIHDIILKSCCLLKRFSRFFIADEFFQSSCIFMSDTWHFYSDFEGGVNSNATTQKSCLFLNANEMEIFFRLDKLLS